MHGMILGCLLLAFLGGCYDAPLETPMDGHDLEVSESMDEDCPDGLIRCGGACVDPGLDREHCGGCGSACVSGVCASSCTNVCSAGQTRCSSLDPDSVETCGDSDGDGCTQWNAPVPCGPDEICSEGLCLVPCDHACSPDGLNRCSEEILNGVELCRDMNGDGCREWSVYQICPGDTVCIGGGMCAVIGVYCGNAYGRGWDLGQDFSLDSNPNAVWTYGWTQPDGTGFDLCEAWDRDGLSGWAGTLAGEGGDLFPDLLFNGTGGVLYLGGEVAVAPGEVVARPGPGRERMDVRWESLGSNYYGMHAEFASLAGVGADVLVQLNRVPISMGVIHPGEELVYDIRLELGPGDRFDFSVGCSSSSGCDSVVVGLKATVCLLP
jgi:hypothetical protein